MSDQPQGSAEIDQALEALEGIATMAGQGRQIFDASPERRLALGFLWINVGSALKQFCRLRGVSQGSSPFPGPIRMRDRLCYQPASGLATDILWDSCAADTGPLIELLTGLRQALNQEP